MSPLACPWLTHDAGVPASEEEPVGEKVGLARLGHLLLQRGKQVIEPGEGSRVPAEPVEIDLGCKGRGVAPGGAEQEGWKDAMSRTGKPSMEKSMAGRGASHTFLVLRVWSACWNLYQMDFRMEAKGVTPMPAPTSMATSYWNTSSLAVPKGPSTSILAEGGPA